TDKKAGRKSRKRQEARRARRARSKRLLLSRRRLPHSEWCGERASAERGVGPSPTACPERSRARSSSIHLLLPSGPRIEPSLQDLDRGRFVDVLAGFLPRHAARSERALCLHRRQPLVEELDAASGRIRNLLRKVPRTTRRLPFRSPHVERQSNHDSA